MRRAFVSRPSDLDPARTIVFESWRRQLVDCGLALVTLERAEYPRDPWPTLCRMIGEADLVVVFGFAHLEASPVGSADASDVGRRPVGSAWTQIEGAIAVALGKPTVVLAEPEAIEGILDPRTWTGRTVGCELVAEPEPRRVHELIDGLLDLAPGPAAEPRAPADPP